MLENLQNYYYYEELVKTQKQIINTKDLNKDNILQHIKGILNICKDGIEQDYVQHMFITVIFADGIDLDLVIFDYYFNLLFWILCTNVDELITSDKLFFPDDITKSYIKRYIDINFLKNNRRTKSFYLLNNTMDDAMDNFKYINDFSLYLMNSLSLKDTVDLINQNKQFRDTLHYDFTSESLENVKKKSIELANQQINIIKESPQHGLQHSFRTNEGVNTKQYSEVAVNIGVKPNADGGVFDYVIPRSYMSGGVKDAVSYLIDEYNSRIAQILSKINVATSGHFARLLELNNVDSFLHENPDYVCRTANFIKRVIENENILYLYDMRYYRLHPRGQDILLDADADKHLIGKTLYFKSPITCASKAHGYGICYRCYGELAKINRDINIGKIAAELLSSQLTQKLLSAKHLLEVMIIKMSWPDYFLNFFSINFNVISISDDLEDLNYKLIIIGGNIFSDDMVDEAEMDDDFVQYVTTFSVQLPNGELYEISTDNNDEIYLSDEFAELILKTYKNIDNDTELIFDFKDLVKIESGLFWVRIKNNDLSSILDNAKRIINKGPITSSYNINGIVQDFTNTLIRGGIRLNSIHSELLISNQVRDADDPLSAPDWEIPNVPYQIFALSSAIMNSPSLTATLQYQRISQILINPLTSKKKAKSHYDWYFMQQPQEFINDPKLVSDDYVPKEEHEKNITCPIHFLNNNNNEDEEEN